MFQKISKIIFVAIFLLLLFMPMLFTNLENRKISESENRYLAAQAKLWNENKEWNKNFTADFENWVNDNIGFRDSLVVQNAKIQYHGFGVLANNSNMYLGPKGELNYATPEILKDYQRKNLYSETKLQEIADSIQILADYIRSKGAAFYYYQAWDKHSIYPEQFPISVLQKTGISKTDAFNDFIVKNTDVTLISPKAELLAEKANYPTYSVWGDPTHWSPRGGYIAYKVLMAQLNKDFNNRFHVLQEEDYNITITDQGKTLFGGIHEEDWLEEFSIKNPKAKLTNEKLTFLPDPSHSFHTNTTVNNKTRLLILGDSYFNNYLIDDLAESFYEVLIIWGDHIKDIETIMETYKPNIVIVENAERVDRTYALINAAKQLSENKQ